MKTVLMLTVSNTFMTWAWYGHLRRGDWPLWKAIMVSWGIAFFEYCFMVPANRAGYGAMSVTQLKIIQEVITLTVFVGFALLYLRETWRWNYLAAFLCILGAVYFAFQK